MTDQRTNPYAAPQIPPGADAAVPIDSLRWPTLHRVHSGLSIYFFGILFFIFVIAVAAVVGFAIGISVAASAAKPGAPRVDPASIAGMSTYRYVVAGLSLAGGVALATGLCLCATVPAESGGRGLALAAAAFEALVVITGLVNLWPQWPLLGMVGTIAQPVSWICTLFFLRRLALYIGQTRQASRATALLVWGGLVVIVWGGMTAFSRLLIVPATTQQQFNPTGPNVAAIMAFGLLSLVALIGSVILLVFYLILIHRLRKMLGQ